MLVHSVVWRGVLQPITDFSIMWAGLSEFLRFNSAEESGYWERDPKKWGKQLPLKELNRLLAGSGGLGSVILLKTVQMMLYISFVDQEVANVEERLMASAVQPEPSFLELQSSGPRLMSTVFRQSTVFQHIHTLLDANQAKSSAQAETLQDVYHLILGTDSNSAVRDLCDVVNN